MESNTKQKKIRILALCDSPTAATGFAQVSRNVIGGLARTGKYDFDVIGINYSGDYYDRDKFPFAIYPAMPQGAIDMYGRDRLMQSLSGAQAKYGLQPPWDIIFTIQDPFVLEGLGLAYPWAEQLRVTEEMWKRALPPDQWYKWIGYWPVDAEVKENWVTRSIALANTPVAYCEWGKSRIMKYDKNDLKIKFNLKIKETDNDTTALLPVGSIEDKIEVIHHGVDTNVFKPLSKEEKAKFRREYFGGKLPEDAYLVVNISRNQPRKDICRTIAAFAEFKKRETKAHLYLHMKSNDAGGSIDEMARNFGLIPVRDYTCPDDFAPGVGFPVEVVNKIYNAADLCITTTLGEGWGFITTEAMATKTPIIAPNITSILDIFNSYVPGSRDLNEWFYSEGKDQVRGIPVKAGSTNSEWVCLGVEDNERVRPLTNVDDLVEKMLWASENPKEVEKITNRAYEWVQNLAWPNIVKQWENLFDRVYMQLETEREVGRQIDKAGRNDPCPCGSGQKFKKCHGAQQNIDRFSDWVEDAANSKKK